ncbi:hypothetical protein GCM10028778_07800 [Barrientosiimonas marina]|uniref:Uncharacterized protein n=1 Tax=Lentibacillus kimchii TaxID=1542911 RepID=A0ABW2UUI4_9BACI
MDNLRESKELPFFARNHSGKVDIKYGVNNDPTTWGLSELEMPINIETAKGFPLCEANVVYDGKGYHSVFGWIQTIYMDIKDVDQQSAFVDVGALFKESDMPFFSFGNLPTLFDAPCIKNVSNMDWTANAFLVMAGNIMMTKDVYYVIGFEWGYEIINEIPQIKPIKELKTEDWNAKTNFLNKEYVNWDFKKGYTAVHEK